MNTDAARLARYIEAISSCGDYVSGPDYESSARAVMEVADGEYAHARETYLVTIEEIRAAHARSSADLRAEVERLTRWKAEAAEVVLGLQDLGKALGMPLGERITGTTATEAARALRSEVERLRSLLSREASTFEQMLADPHEQFDPEGEALTVWLNADGTTSPVKDIPSTTGGVGA